MFSLSNTSFSQSLVDKSVVNKACKEPPTVVTKKGFQFVTKVNTQDVVASKNSSAAQEIGSKVQISQTFISSDKTNNTAGKRTVSGGNATLSTYLEKCYTLKVSKLCVCMCACVYAIRCI